MYVNYALFLNNIYYQGSSLYVLLSNNGSQPVETGGSHWLTFLPDHIYCFLPSYAQDKGEVKVLDFLPEWLVEDFLFCKELDLTEV